MNQQATELEEAIIGACLIEQEALPLVADKLRPEMFYDNRHQLIFACLTAMYQAGKKIDILTVKEELVHRGNLEEAGGAFAIAQLSSKVASSAHIEYHAQIVHQKYLAREAVLGFNKLLACAMDETMDIGDTLIDAHNLLDRLEGESGHQDHMRDMETLMADALKEAEDRIAKSVNGVTGIPTGLNELDKKTGGLQDGEMVVIAARPSVGKTAFALHLARSAASAGKAVAVYSLEMEGERLADRWLLAASNINPYRWRNGLANPQEVAEAHTTSGELSQLPIYVDDNSSVSMEHVRSSARLLKSRKQCDMVIIDYLQLMSGSGKSTLLNILGILDTYDTGTYLLNGQLIQNLSESRAAELRNRMIGFIFQSFNLISFKNAVENVALPLYYQGVSRKKRNAMALEYLDMVGLKDWADHMPNEMSGGQKQRVAIGSAIASDKEVLVFDEPTSGLDYHHMIEVATNLIALSKMGKTLFIITHDPELIAQCCNYFMFIEHGKIKWSGGWTADNRQRLHNFFSTI